MIKKRVSSGLLLATLIAITVGSSLFGVKKSVYAKSPQKWKMHDMARPKPVVIEPGTSSTQNKPGDPPSDAIVLFDGTDLSKWCKGNSEPATWKVENGYMQVVKKSGSIRTRQEFGDCQLHIEWMAPVPAKGKGQGRGNSGIYLMSNYEVQVLDSYNNETYADGQAASIYGQYPPLVNANRPPGEWQSYDIIFQRPHFDKDGKLVQPAYITVIQNGIVVQNHVELLGNTAGKEPQYQPHADKLPISLQDHGNPVRYRNIWIRELQESEI